MVCNSKEIYEQEYMSTTTQIRIEQIKAALIAVGADRYDLWLPETHRLAAIIHADERIVGIVYGRYTQAGEKVTGRGALVATTQRILLLDKKPMYERFDEISYGIVSAVSYTKAGIAGTVILHTRMGDISVRTLNKLCAQNFVEAIESKLFASGDSDV
jgi:hypothetical protein